MAPEQDCKPLIIDERTIRKAGPGHVVAVCWRQIRAERALARKGIHFRTTDPELLESAYDAMSADEFHAINGRQDWANWRTVPRTLSGHVPDRPLSVLDLGCGTGASTRVLAYYCPPGSRIIGYELAPSLLKIARKQAYRQRDGSEVAVDFVCQSVSETFKQADDSPVPEDSVDLVNASGVVGHHLDVSSGRQLAAELKRVLAPGGIASLDVGPTLDAPTLTGLMSEAGFRLLARRKSWFLDPCGQLVFRAP